MINELPQLSTNMKMGTFWGENLRRFIKKKERYCTVLLANVELALAEDKKIIMNCHDEDMLSYIGALHYMLPDRLASRCTFNIYGRVQEESFLITGVLDEETYKKIIDEHEDESLLFLDFINMECECEVNTQYIKLVNIAERELFEDYLCWLNPLKDIEEVLAVYDFVENPTVIPKVGCEEIIRLIGQENLLPMFYHFVEHMNSVEDYHLSVVLAFQEILKDAELEELLVKGYVRWCEAALNESDVVVFEDSVVKLYHLPLREKFGRRLLDEPRLKNFWLSAAERFLVNHGEKALSLFGENELEILLVLSHTVVGIETILCKALGEQIEYLSADEKHILLMSLTQTQQGKCILDLTLQFYYEALKKEPFTATINGWKELVQFIEDIPTPPGYREMVYQTVGEIMDTYVHELIEIGTYEGFLENKTLLELANILPTSVGKYVCNIEKWFNAQTIEEKAKYADEFAPSMYETFFKFLGGMLCSDTRSAVRANYQFFKRYDYDDKVSKAVGVVLDKGTPNDFKVVINVLFAYICFDEDYEWCKEIIEKNYKCEAFKTQLYKGVQMMDADEQEKLISIIKEYEPKYSIWHKVKGFLKKNDHIE